MKKTLLALFFILSCSAVYSLPATMVSTDSAMAIWGINYSFGPENGKNCFGIFFIEDIWADRSNSYFAPGMELIMGGWDYFLWTVDAYYMINPGTSSVIYPVKFGIGLVNTGIDIMDSKNEGLPWQEFTGYTVSAGIIDFAVKTSSDGKGYFTPYIDVDIDGTLSGKINPRIEFSPAFSFLDVENDTGDGGYYYYYY